MNTMFSLRCQHLLRLISNVQTLLSPKETSNTSNSNILYAHKGISTTSVLLVDYYGALGIPAKSTQSEIKAAYYKLSMVYHPDKNQGSESAAKKFREITQAYEVLSNYRLRRLYDKGIIHTAGPQYAKQAPSDKPDFEEAEEDDPQTKFYKSRFTKSKVANSQGQNPIYDFDEWARAHYGKSMNRKRDAQERFNRKQAQREDNRITFQKEIVIYSLVIGTILVFIVTHMESNYDRPNYKKIDK